MNIFNNIRNYIDENKFSFTFCDNKLDLLNFNNILEVNDNKIIIKSDKKITIIGKNLKINKLYSKEIVIEGTIKNISLDE